ncbi:hypothetical protein HYPSUDRAFT_59880 [Hypholoma sublateritium FD-334 SS-4]|uniref:Uncharacterized protein n=1 Tax=Hypholoma sublateritium (strain FD-334 SS-4) TaxID=945553 RepID=A0A0D2N2K8_HYPSF|nr:hypothetical protein HYPSUDRAFT_59880 [Hypholoma sublateritium FD-334 SS-4]
MYAEVDFPVLFYEGPGSAHPPSPNFERDNEDQSATVAQLEQVIAAQQRLIDELIQALWQALETNGCQSCENEGNMECTAITTDLDFAQFNWLPPCAMPPFAFGSSTVLSAAPDDMDDLPSTAISGESSTSVDEQYPP